MTERLLPCPFCGGKAAHRPIDSGPLAGGSFILCESCEASTALMFGGDRETRKARLPALWNKRTYVSPRTLDEGENAWDAPTDIPEDVWEVAYGEAEVFSPVYGCDEEVRFGLTEAFARAILAERARCATVTRETIPDGEPLSPQRTAHRAAIVIANSIEGKDNG